jgi:hypothetical protein
MGLLDIGPGFDWISPTIKTLRGLNECIARGQEAISGEKVLKRAGIPCAFDIDMDGNDCGLSVRKQDVDRAIKALRSGK